MKKILFLVAVLAMMLVVAAPAFAGDRNDNNINQRGHDNVLLNDVDFGDFDIDEDEVDFDLDFDEDDFDFDYDVSYVVDNDDDAVVLYYLPLYNDILDCPFYGDFDGVVNHYDCFD